VSIRLRPALAALPDYDPRDLTDDGIAIRLHRNESALQPPAFVVDAVRAIGAETLRTYPTATQHDVSERLAARFSREIANLALANGADEMLAACARAVLDAGDNAITLAPTFGMYGRVVALAGASVRRVPYARRWRLDPQAVVAAADERTRLVILGHPNNPTGDALLPSDLQTIARALPDALILVDEVYLTLSDRSLARAPSSKLDNVVVVGSFSKCASLAGTRLGYLLAPAWFAAAIRRSLGPYPVSSLSLIAAQAYLRDAAAARAFETQLEAQVARSLDAIESSLRPFTRQTWRGPANFVLADCGSRAAGLRDGLAERGIAVRTFDDPMLAGMVRLCAATDEITAVVTGAIRAIATKENAYA
jgi:histidinol-phosphate aminotransferase